MDEVKNASGKSHTENEFNSDLRYISDFNKIRRLLSCTRRAVDEYDLILTGDLSKYGSEVFIEIMKEFSYTIGGNYDDAGKMLYDIKNQEVFAGGSGCGCISLVAMGYVVDCLKKGIYNKVLLIATGALMNPIMVAQNETIPAIAHAVVLERSNL